MNFDLSIFTRRNNKAKREKLIIETINKLKAEIQFELQKLSDIEGVIFVNSKNNVPQLSCYYIKDDMKYDLDITKISELPDSVIDFYLPCAFQIADKRVKLKNLDTYRYVSNNIMSTLYYVVEKFNDELGIACYVHEKIENVDDKTKDATTGRSIYYLMFPFNVIV